MAHWRRRLDSSGLLTAVVLVVAALATLSVASAASANTIEPPNAQVGAQETVFNWSSDSCDYDNLPDLPVRAFRDSSNQVHLTFSHFVNRQMVGPDLDHVTLDCTPTYSLDANADPAMFDDRGWIAAPYTLDGNTVYALVHEEYRGNDHAGMCTTTYSQCLYNALTLATSTNRGNTFSNTAPPNHLIGTLPYQYVPDSGPWGLFNPSNIVKHSDGYYYTLLHLEAYRDQARGTCVMRTPDLSDPTAWRAWDGSGFNVQFINPYVDTLASPTDHVCRTLSRVQKMSESLTYNTYFNQYMLAGAFGVTNPATGQVEWGFSYSLSSDLVNWTKAKLLMKAELTWTWTCGDADPVLYPSLLDPDSQSRNFETTDQRPYLYFTTFHPSPWCYLVHDRDLNRMPIEFSDQVAGGPTSQFSISHTPALVGQPVSFDASASSDSDGTVVDYKWDLDGDGTFETDTGSNPTASKTYDARGGVTVRLRTVDDTDKHTDTTHTVTITNPPTASFTASPDQAQTGETVAFDGSASSGSDGTVVDYKWDLDGNGTFETDTGTSATATKSYASSGPVTVALRVTDKDGATAQATRDVTVTNRPPTASFTAQPSPVLTGHTVNFDASASGDPDGTITSYKWDLDGNGTFETDTGSSPTTSSSYSSAGSVTVGLRTTDDAGDHTDTTRSVQISAPPVASFTAQPNPALTGQTVSFNASASSDPDGTITSYQWDLDGNGTFETDTGASATATKSYASSGPVTVGLRVTDNDGTADQTTTTVTVDNRPPTASFTAQPNPALTGQAVSFNASASSDPDGTITSYQWDLDGNGTFETDTGTSPAATKSYATAGPVTVRLQVTDDHLAAGQTTTTVTVTNRPPSASFTATPNPVQAGQTVNFNASASSDPDGTIANVKWDLDGNGTFETDTGTSRTTSRSYSSLGNVAVKLRVTDNVGATTDATVTVGVRYLAKVNFQPGAAPVPAGYVVDSGAAYTTARGYGWFREDSLNGVHAALDMTKNTVDRNLVTDQRLDTLIFMQAKGGAVQKTAGAWEIAVPNGSYTVTISVGDASSLDSTHRINVEGQNAIAGFKPTSTVRFGSATKVVTVANGRLTIDATGGTNTKMNYVDIASN